MRDFRQDHENKLANAFSCVGCRTSVGSIFIALTRGTDGVVMNIPDSARMPEYLFSSLNPMTSGNCYSHTGSLRSFTLIDGQQLISIFKMFLEKAHPDGNKTLISPYGIVKAIEYKRIYGVFFSPCDIVSPGASITRSTSVVSKTGFRDNIMTAVSMTTLYYA